MNAVVEVSVWHKFTTLTLKNFYVSLKTYEIAVLVPLVPSAFAIFLIIVRLMFGVTHRPSKIFRKLSINRTWAHLITDIEERREIIRYKEPTFNHSVYVPQPTIAFAPPDIEYKDVIAQAVQDYIKGVNYIGFKTCKKLKETMKTEHFFAGVCFSMDFTPSTNLNITYVFPSELRIYNDSHIGSSWQTNSAYDNLYSFDQRMMKGHDGGYVGYLREGFLAVQHAVAMVYIQRELEGETPVIKLQRFPFRAHAEDRLTGGCRVSVSLVLILGNLYPAYIITNTLVKEKKSNLRLLLKSMGVANWIQTLSWFTVFITLTLISSFIISSLLKIDWRHGRSVLPQINFGFLLISFIAYNTATVSFCIMISSFFSEPKYAVPFLGMIWVCSYVPHVAFLTNSETSSNLWPTMYTFCNSVLALLFDQIMEFEKFSNHIDISYLYVSPFSNHKMSAVAYVLLLFALSIVYILIGLYVENLSFDFCERMRMRYLISRPRRDVSRRTSRRAYMREGGVYEIEPAYKNVIVGTEDLCKVFDGEYAVKDVSLNIYEGDITAFMGHNGSGKTVLLQMIAGLLVPTSGKVLIENSNVDTTKLSRKNVGVSFHDATLFPKLSALEQLTLLARLRGLAGADLQKNVEKYLRAMDLFHRKDLLPKQLNKAERHFLSVCCALVGKTKIVLLDEPSKWLDSMARRALWELLRSESRKKTIIIATNCEEEAESLADRIGILCWGELKCFGSAFFLKKIYGQGHRLIIYKETYFRKEMVTQIIQKYESTANVESEIGIQITYILNDIAPFIPLADELEVRAEELGINGISISEMNSADIFLKKGAQDPTDGDRLRHSEMMNGDTIYFRSSASRYVDTGSERVKPLRLFINQCKVLLYKRILSTIRIFQQSLLQLILPILLTTISFSLLTVEMQNTNLSDMRFSLQTYPFSVSLYYISDEAAENPIRNVSFKAYQEKLFWLGNTHKEHHIPSHVQNIYEYMLEQQAKHSDLENNKRIVGVSFEKEDITALFHNYPMHTAPLSLNMVHNSVLRSGTSAMSIKTAIFPLPFESKHRAVRGRIPLNVKKYLAIDISFCVGFSWTLSIIFLVRERRKNFKLYQQLMGVECWVFWLNHFIYDIITIFATTLIIEIIIILFEVDPFEEHETMISFFFTLFSAGVFLCSANYLTSVIWSDPVLAYVTVSILNAVGTMSYWILVEAYYMDLDEGIFTSRSSFPIFMKIFPHYALCRALVKSLTLSELNLVCQSEALRYISIEVEKCQVEPRCCESFNNWTFNGGVLFDLAIILVYGVVCWILLFLLEAYRRYFKKIFQRKKDEMPEAKEKEFGEFSWTNSQPPRKTFTETIDQENLEVLFMDRMTFRRKVLICEKLNADVCEEFSFNDITFTVNRAECFVILGKNASGKTSLIDTLVGALPMTSGRVQIDGLDLKTDKEDIYQRIGYFPSEDTFLPEYKLIEMFKMMCLIKGIPAEQVSKISENLAKMLGLYNQLGKRLRICSAGVRRRFNFACALIGEPQLVFLDDVKSSLDIASQRQVWKAISNLRAQGRSAILTSTTTRDCECVADRFLVLSKGEPILITDPLSLNDFYKSGYILKMKIKKILVSLPNQSDDWIVPKYQSFSANPFIKLATFIENEFPVFQMKEKLGNIVEYFIPKENNSISKIYRLMQRNAFNLYVEDFTITTCTLPMLFLEILEREQRS